MDFKKYFNSGSKKRDLSSETSTSGDDPNRRNQNEPDER